MTNRKYVYGYDFGTLSCRLIIVNIATGEIVAQGVEEYPNGVISEQLPNSDVILPPEWYLQDPDDYIIVLSSLSKRLLKETGISPKDVIGIGSCFTNCTMMPMDIDGTVLCQKKEYRNDPHAWVKLWKHHGAQPYAEEIEAYAKENVDWLGEYGNNVSSEWFFPKVLQIYRESPEIYKRADVFIEAADWIVYKMTGNLIRNSATLGVNSFWNPKRGYPSKEFFYNIEPGLENVIEEKMKGEIAVVGTNAGNLTPEFAELLGLTTDTVVSVGHGDSEVAACGTSSVDSGTMIIVMGTSTCHQMIHNTIRDIDGISSVIMDGMIPGFYAYQSGQPAVGDIFDWYGRNLASAEYIAQAKEEGLSILEYMNKKASGIKAGESGLVALDWFNGNRSVLMNYNLTGMIMGLTLQTKPEEIFRALLEATAFGTKTIIDGYESKGVFVKNIIGAGGLSRKSPLIMQIYADVLNREISVPNSANNSALGAAVCGAVAAKDKSGYNTVLEAIDKMVPKDFIRYYPNEKNHRIYQELYKVYKQLHDYLGGDIKSPMKVLKDIERSLG